jgi:hypothetical protein
MTSPLQGRENPVQLQRISPVKSMAVRSGLDTLTFRMGKEARTHVNGV